MAKSKVFTKLDRFGIDGILKSSQMAAVLKDVADGVADAAGAGYEVRIERDRRKSRVIAHVLDPSDRAMGREIATGNLARAVGSKESGWTWRR